MTDDAGWTDIVAPGGALAFLALPQPAAGGGRAFIPKPGYEGGYHFDDFVKENKPWRKFARGVGWIWFALALYELYRRLEPDVPTGGRMFGSGWTLCCRRSTNPVPAGYPIYAIKNLGGVGTVCTGFNCNHPGPVVLLSTTEVVQSTTKFYTVRTDAVPDGNGFVMDEWRRPAAARVWPHGGRLFRGHGTPASLSEALADPGGALNPNVARAVPLSFKNGLQPALAPGDAPFLDPALDLAPNSWESDDGVIVRGPALRVTVTPGVGTPIAPGPAPGTRPGPPPRPAPVPTPQPGPGTVPAPGTGGCGSVVRSWPTHPRQPPKKNQKERKVKSRGLRLFDIISEAGDAIDCFYKALPKATRNKWDKKQSRYSKMAENVGQFGLGGADYKSQALYHNWDAVDLGAALQCLVTNEIEDRIIGKIAAKSRGTAFGVSQTFRNLKNWKG